MRWWLHTDPPHLFSVDNASVTGMDYSMLDPLLYMVQWTEGKGEIEYQVDPDTNENGLREGFYDVTPWVSFFDQFLERIPRLTLDQAKKVKIDLIKQLFESKRQMPFHYPIAAGDYWWDATDGSLFASSAGGLQNATIKINELANALNALVSNINSVVVGGVNSGIVPVGNTLIGQVNSIVVQEVNATVVNGVNSVFSNLASNINSGITYNGNMTIGHINTVVIGTTGDTSNTINAKLHSGTFPIGEVTYFSAMPGLSIGVDMAKVPYTFADVPVYSVSYINSIAPGNFSNVSAISWTNIGGVVPANAQWIPIGSTVPVNVTPDEQTAILKGIAERTNELFIVKNQKISEVNALTTIDDVIAYDVLADWPDIPMPPGFKLEGPISVLGGGLTLAGTPPPAPGGVPEAPVNGLWYARKDAAWADIATNFAELSDLTPLAPLASPNFTGNPRAPTPTAGDADTSVATTAFVANAISTAGGSYQPLDPDLTSLANASATNAIYYRSGPDTWSPVTLEAASMALSSGTLSALVEEAGTTGIVYGRQTGGWANLGLIFATLDSPVLTGDPRAPTPPTTDNDTSIATTAYVKANLANYQPLDPDLTSIAGYNGVGGWLYRSAADTWSPVAIGSGLTFVNGTLAAIESATSEYKFSTSTSPPPATGYIRTNNASATAATILYIHKTTNAGTDLARFLEDLDVGSQIYVQDKDTSASFAKFDVTGPAVDQTSYFQVPVSNTEVGGTALSNNTTVLLYLTRGGAGGAGGGGIADAPVDGVRYVRQNAGWVSGDAAYASLASPIFTGDPRAPTPATADNDTSIATTAFVKAQGYVTGGPYQPQDSELTALAGLTSAADRLPYFNGAGTAALATFTTFGRSLVDDADAGTAQTTLGISTFVKTILDDADAAAVRTTIGAQAAGNYQPLDGDLTALAALTGTNTIYYRSGTDAWSSVTIGTGLTFSSGTLSATGGGGGIPEPGADGFYGRNMASGTGSWVSAVKKAGDTMTGALAVTLDSGVTTATVTTAASQARFMAGGTAADVGVFMTAKGSSGIYLYNASFARSVAQFLSAAGSDTSFCVTAFTGYTQLTAAPAGKRIDLQGTSAADNAPAGFVGEYLETRTANGSAFPATTWANATTLVLTPGDWDVWGFVSFTGLVSGYCCCSISPTSGAPNGALGGMGLYHSSPNGDGYSQAGPYRFSVAANTTVYVLAYTQAACTLAASHIRARRIR